MKLPTKLAKIRELIHGESQPSPNNDLVPTSTSICPLLNNSVNKVIESLEPKTSGAGCLDITGVDDISLVDEETLNSKNWALSNVGH